MAITTNFNTAVLALVDDLVTADRVDISNAIYIDTFEVGDIAEGHQIVTGIRPGALIPILDNSPNYGAFPVKATNNCSIPACDLDLGFSTKAWQTAMIACKIPICINSFDENFLLFRNQHKRLFGDADLNSALLQYIIDLFQKNFMSCDLA